MPLKFFSGILFSTSGAQKAIPFLQQVFQADACHMKFGKYTLYSCYGTTANCNTYPVAFGILFGNEDKEGWMDFCDFAKSVHPSIDDTRVTIRKNLSIIVTYSGALSRYSHGFYRL